MSKRTRRADVLAVEQRAVDHAYRSLERTRREATELKSVAASASGKDAIDANRTWQRELDSLDLGKNALVFMRADVEDGAGPETFYIGRRSVLDSDRNPAVISWSAPAAVRWRLTSEQEPGDVRLLRQIVCDERVVRRFFNLHGTGGGGQVGAAQEERGNGSVPQVAEDEVDGTGQNAVLEEQEWRDPLLDELDRARDGAMHDIVETIQRDQLRLVTEQPSGVLIVQGGPGTGKTAVGMHRVSWLLDNKHMAADDVLVVGPNRGFLDYVGTTLVELGSSGVTMLELPALWSGGGARRDPHRVAVLKSDARMSSVLKRAVDNQTTSTAERLETLVGGPVFTFELRRREVVVPVTEIAEIAGAALAGESPYRVRQERCAQRVVQHLTQTYTGLLPGPADTDYFAEIRQLRPVTRLLRRIAPELSTRDVLRRLFSSGVTMAAAANGILTPEEQSVLLAHHESAGRPGSAREPSLDDLVCLDELEHILSGRPERIYGHVVVDEAQDITPMQARSLARRCPGGSMTILGDLAQATGSFPYQDWEQLGATLTGRDGWRVAELLTGFRVPGEVMDFVRPLGGHCAPGIAIPDSVRRTGVEVIVSEGAGPAERAAERARNLAAGADGAAAGRTTAVIVPEEASWRETVAAAVTEYDSVAVLTADEAKGLEFDHVVVVEPSAIVGDDAAGLRSLYVALTRCMQSLTVVHDQPLPRWIGGPVNAVPTPKQFMAQVSRRKTPHGGPGLCTRYRADGTRCDNETRQPDGWCRQPGCGGFRTAEPAPLGKGGYLRAPKDAETGARLELSSERIADIRISSAACGSFVARHRGGLGEAAVELHATLTPFLTRGRHLRSADGWFLDLDGYRIALDAEAGAVTAYASGHPERSYAQFAAGIPSRVGQEARAGRRSALTPSAAEDGADLVDDAAMRNLSTGTLHVTVSACVGYERVSHFRDLPDEEFLRQLREELSADLSNGRIERVGERLVIDGERCQWSLRSDGRVLMKVRKSGSEIYRGFAIQEADGPQPEGTGMPAITAEGEALTVGRETESGSGLSGAVAVRERAARADRSHESLRHRLLADLYERSSDVGDSDHVDAWSLGSEGMTLFEVLGEGAHTYAQIREAALHLLEAACLHPGGQAEYLVIVLREAPAEPWTVEVADRAFSVGLAWRDGAGWAGPGARHITDVATDEDSAR
ncbi:UvrD-helicase domain-containing protein [Streptomyces sp. 2A115]|uniref:UvrD-helicase domain-containing protein n=1 Tax=Streptomyces sp. 2A115 TaxID=3457439 RepID=UPI003FD3B044